MKSKFWILGFFILVAVPLAIVASQTIKVDPYFHYHKPDTTTYFYSLNYQRGQNDGITRNFDYEGLITGTSMTANFKTSEAENIFGYTFIKVPYSAGTYREINDNLKVALSYNPNLKIIIRGLDMQMFINDKDALRSDLGTYPTYLYNENPLDDVQYIFNRDVVFKRVYHMVTANDAPDFQPGISSFDSYSNWMRRYKFGVNALFPNGTENTNTSVVQDKLTDDERELILGNVRQNVTSLAEKNPNVMFYYFFTPYSAAWWQSLINDGNFDKTIEAERIVIEEILKVDNIKLYSFNNLTEITTDLNNYENNIHYASWINSLMLKYMKNETCLLTKENYENYLSTERAFYWTFNYKECFDNQEDYEQDYFAEAILNKKINDVNPFYFSKDFVSMAEIKNAEIVENQHEGKFGVICNGSLLSRAPESEISVDDYIKNSGDFNGFRITIDDISDYKYLIAYGKKITDQGQPSIYIFNNDGMLLGQTTASYESLDGEWHQYIINIASLEGKVDIVFHGGYIDSTGSADSKYVFSDITLY